MTSRTKKVAIGSLILLFLGWWAICHWQKSPTPNSGGNTVVSAVEEGAASNWTLASAAAPFRGTTIRLIGEDYPPLQAISTLKTDFEKETGIKVEVEGYEAEAVLQKVALDLASGAGQYDLVIQVYFDMGRLVTQNQIRPLSPYLSDQKLRDPSFEPERDLFSVWHNMGWYDGKPYGFPMMVLTMYTWYRKDLFENSQEREAFQKKYGYELKPPATWQQYQDIAQFFTRPPTGLYGTLIQGKRHMALWQEYINFLYSFGGEILETKDPSRYGPIAINSSRAIEATEYYRSLAKFSPPDTLNFTWDDALALMQQGKVAMCLMWNDSTYALEDPTQSKVAGSIGYALVPAGAAGVVQQVGGQSFYIPTGSKNAEAAYLFMQWMMDKDVQVRQQKLGGSSARRSTYEDPEVLKLPWMATNIAALESPHPPMLYTFPESLQVGEVIKKAISEVLAGQVSTKKALDQAALDLKTALGPKVELKYPPVQK
jgi:multiple sugar transport system substrate-binding protein